MQLWVNKTTIGPIVKNEIYGSGAFEVPGFVKVQASSCKFKYLDGNIYEGIGIEPDVHIPYTSLLSTNGVDIQLEKAIAQILD